MEKEHSILDSRGMGRPSWIIAALTLLAACASGETPERYSHDSMCGGPAPGWLRPSDGIADHRIVILVRLLRDGRLLWDGEEISADTLTRQLNFAGELATWPQVALAVAEGAECVKVRAVRQRMVTSRICSEHRLCGEGRSWSD